MAAEPPNEADDCWSSTCIDPHTVAHSLWRFQMLIAGESKCAETLVCFSVFLSFGAQSVSDHVY